MAPLFSPYPEIIPYQLHCRLPENINPHFTLNILISSNGLIKIVWKKSSFSLKSYDRIYFTVTVFMFVDRLEILLFHFIFLLSSHYNLIYDLLTYFLNFLRILNGALPVLIIIFIRASFLSQILLISWCNFL